MDDEARILRTLQRFLEHRGHRVAAVNTVADALASLDCSEFDVIVCDIKMPGGGGHAVYSALRGREPRPSIVSCR